MPKETPRLPFEIDDTIDPTLVTGRAGVALVIELFRQLGSPRHLMRRSRSSSTTSRTGRCGRPGPRRRSR
jgi:hypothetical protein